MVLRVPNIAYIRHRLALGLGELPVTSSWFGSARDLGPWRRTYGWDGGHLHYFTLPLLRRLLAEAGFEVRAVSDAGARFARIREWFPELLCGNLLIVADPI